ncbi:hypothetical protein P3553_26495 [Vibrio parahaemolyticus]|uniref:hypothetical protein n=1 Tax=Vibrio parahaemolyticus TaxID=670 RepID=UPI001F5D1946|nr:hypothetical protein [Vibrio parahaemolyticus]MDF4755759.1 hypothetical protein [Vibrio parahaemolyticus]MDF4781981.1 hypothetical protein [Vibrio parahaemolyticus]MDF4786806.1 hypothetical protein [Vibrio parahaemolyticus]MDF4797614.1 hypothetical protein [Vibrio parahaemolyticus]MDF4825560.1 hypothetical protein [Vibrio parahaemolyticus]
MTDIVEYISYLIAGIIIAPFGFMLFIVRRLQMKSNQQQVTNRESFWVVGMVMPL